MVTPPPPSLTEPPLLTGSATGCGLLGCAAGTLLGLIGGSGLLVALSLLLAANGSVTPTNAADRVAPDLRLTVQEHFLNRVVQDSLEENARLDLLPNNQFQVILDTELSVLGAVVPLQVTGLFGLELVGQSLQVELIQTDVAGIDLPPELTDFFGASLPQLNQEVNEALQEISAGLGIPLIFSDLGTTDSQLWLEASEAP
jgi:hypothetical protein